MDSSGARSEESFRRPPTAQEAVTRELRRAILAGELRPGQRIHQEELAGRLGVSRVPIREALRGLEAEGQVTGKPNRGYYVTKLTVADLDEVYRLRALLEDEMNAQAAKNAAGATIDQLESLMAQMEQATEAHDVRAFSALNREFHFTIFERAGLPRFLRIDEVLWQNSEAYRSMYLNDPEILRRIRGEHLLILDAFRSGDSEGLVEQSRRHREEAVARLGHLLAEPIRSQSDGRA